MIDRIIEQFKSITNITLEAEDEFRSRVVVRQYPKKHILLKPGEICNYMYFIVDGILLSYYEKNKEEVTNWFLMETDIALSLLSFHRRQPSFEYIQAFTDCEVVQLHYDDIMALYAKYLEFNIVGRVLGSHYQCLSEERSIALRGSAVEKYSWLMENNPEAIRRIPNKYIASYLGISEFTLSRIRSGDH